MEERKLNLLRALNERFPLYCEVEHFGWPMEERQVLLNALFELKDRSLIDGHFQVSAGRDSYGLPITAIGLRITEEGRAVLEGRASGQQNQTFNNTITITNSSAINMPVSNAGGDVSLSQSIDAEVLFDAIDKQIEKADLPPEEKGKLKKAAAAFVTAAAPQVVSGIIVSATKACLGLP